MKPNYFKGYLDSLQNLKKHYKELALFNHPDRGGDTAIMQAINAEYEYIIKNKLFAFCSANDEKNYSESYELLYPEIITELLKLNGLNIEICGSWLWISGITYPVKDKLKQIGCYFAPKKQMWYYRPEQEKCPNYKGSLPIDLIRVKYGSTVIEGTVSARQLI